MPGGKLERRGGWCYEIGAAPLLGGLLHGSWAGVNAEGSLEALQTKALDNQAMGCGWGIEFASIAIFSSQLLF